MKFATAKERGHLIQQAVSFRPFVAVVNKNKPVVTEGLGSINYCTRDLASGDIVTLPSLVSSRHLNRPQLKSLICTRIGI